MTNHSKLLIAIIFTMLTSILYPSSSAHAERYAVPDINIVIHGEAFENHDMEYPILAIDGKNYVPLSWHFARAMGLSTHFTKERILYLGKRQKPEFSVFSSISKSNRDGYGSPTAITYPIFFEGEPLTSSAPVYNIAGITYLSISDTPALKLNETYSREKGLIINYDETIESLESTFNTLDSLDASRLIRNQGTEATCWAFAANSMFEIAIARKTGIYYDFSETHLIENAPVPSTFESGGNFTISSMYYLNRKGPIEHSDMPLFTLKNYRVYSDQLHQTKEAIKQYGAVLTSIHLDENNKKIYNEKNATYYNPDKNNLRTHELILVGWDDHYDRTLFASKPERNGAFIALNSFGNSWGDGGLLYISYEDAHVLSEVYAITEFETFQSTDRSYYYDKTGLTHYESYEGKLNAFGINNFTAERDEVLDRIGFFASSDLTEARLMLGTSHYVVGNGTFSRTIMIEGAGYYTIDLPIPLNLKRGDTFWVGVEFTGKSPFLVPIEAPYPGILAPVFGAPNEGFIGSGSAYSDLTQIRKNASIAIRAITGIE